MYTQYKNTIKILIVSIFFVGTPLLQGRSIPGIDPGEMAVDSEKKETPAEKEKKPTPVPIENYNPYIEGPITEEQVSGKTVVSKLTAEVTKDDHNSVQLKWEVNERNESEIYVARLDEAILTHDKLLDAYNLTTPPLKSDETSFLDRGVPDGNYYYAVVTRDEVKRRGSITLIPGVNVTAQPVVIKTETPEVPVSGPAKEAEPKFQEYRVKNLTAENRPESVMLRWDEPLKTNGDLVYSVYRGTHPMDSAENLKKATKLGEFPAGTVTYEDREPLPGKELFYGVTVTEKTTGHETLPLALYDSYIINTFKTEEGSETVSLARQIPGALIATLYSGNGTKIYWVNPETEYSQLRLYRSSEPIISKEKLAEAKLLARISHGKTSYEDLNLKEGNYYYALMVNSPSGQEIDAFFEDHTYTANPVTIQPETAKSEQPTEPEVKPEEGATETPPTEEKVPPVAQEEKNEILYFQVLPDGGDVRILWDLEKEDPEISALLFRSERPLTHFSQVEKYGERITELSQDEKEYTDKELAPGSYYYALILQRNGQIDPEMKIGKNYLPTPIVMKKPEEPKVEPEHEVAKKPEEPKPDYGSQTPPHDGGDVHIERLGFSEQDFQKQMNRLNRILATTYVKGNFDSAVRYLQPIIEDEMINERVKARAMLYAGISYFNLKQYKKALKYFSNTTVMDAYPQRADFWYGRTVQRVR